MILALTGFVVGYAAYLAIVFSGRSNTASSYRRLGADDVHPPDSTSEPTAASI